MTIKTDIDILRAGLTRYGEGLTIQAEAAAIVRDGGRSGIIITIRHHPVITLGRRTDDAEVLVSQDRLAELGIDIHRVDRGGGATYHYPEQAVLYPILNLTALKLDVPTLLKISGNAVIEVLRTFGVLGNWHEDKPGVYLDDGAKIASIGFHLSKGLTTHGISINMGAGWDGFRLIDPCKVKNQPISSVQDVTGDAPDPDAFAAAVADTMTRMITSR